jgi:hypothetical protein
MMPTREHPQVASIRLVSPAPERGLIDLDNLPSIWKRLTKVEWLIDGILPLGSVTLFSAASGTGKTWLAHAIAGAVAHGQSFLGRAVKRRPVRYFDGENPDCVVKARLEMLGIEETSDFGVWGGWLDEPPPGPDDERVLACARTCEPLFIWDSLVHFNTGDEQSSTDTRAFMTKFRALAHAGATVLLLHHTGKAKTSKQYRGSSDIPAAVDMAYKLEGEPRDGGLHQLTLRNFKNRFAPEAGAISMELRKGSGFEPIDTPGAAPRASVESIVEEIIAAQPGLSGQLIVEQASPRAGKNKVRAYLRDRASRAGPGRTRFYHPLAVREA